MYSLAVFPRQVPIPTDWLDTKNITDAFHHCNCYCTPPSGSTRDPIMTTWFHGICPFRYPYGLYNSTQNILLADLEDPELLHCLQSESYLGLFSFLSDLEWFVYNEFNTFLKYPIVMFYFKRYTKSFTSGIDVRAKVFGMGHRIVPICRGFNNPRWDSHIQEWPWHQRHLEETTILLNKMCLKERLLWQISNNTCLSWHF